MRAPPFLAVAPALFAMVAGLAVPMRSTAEEPGSPTVTLFVPTAQPPGMPSTADVVVRPDGYFASPRSIATEAPLAGSPTTPGWSPAAPIAPGTVLVGPTGAPHGDPESMVVEIVRDASSDCGTDCREWIRAEGVIDPATPARFRRILAALDGRRLPVVLHSDGGSAVDALRIGLAIRDHRLPVVIGRSRPEPCAGASCGDDPRTPRPAVVDVEARPHCVSSCVLMLAAGAERIAPHDAFVAVHQAKREEKDLSRTCRVVGRVIRDADGRSPCPLPRSLAPYYEYLLQYLPRMDVDLRVLDLTLATRNDETRRLDEGELLSTRLATEIAPAAAVVARLGARPVPPHAAKGAKTSTTRS